MAVGDQVSDLQALLINGVLDIRPVGATAAEQWTIHNLYYGVAVELNYTNGTLSVPAFDSDPAKGARLGAVFHVNNTRWLQIKALAAGNIGYDGIIAK